MFLFAQVQVQTLVTDLFARMNTAARDDEGQALTEYALILGLIAVLAIFALGLIGTGVRGKLNSIADAVT